MFQNLVQNTKKPLQPSVGSLTDLMNDRSEEARFHVNQMTAGSFIGSRETLTNELKEFINYSRVDGLMITSPIFNHQDKLKSLKIVREVVDLLYLLNAVTVLERL